MAMSMTSSPPNTSSASTGSKIVYTHTDEAPALATYSLLPIITAFTDAAGVDVEMRDISLAGRIIAAFADTLEPHQRRSDALAALGEWTQDRDANIIKLPNISASVPQIKGTIAELQSAGYAVPDYPDDPADASEVEIRERYDRVKGSAVNPVLREGNSDRRAPRAVKEYARQYPHSMGAWSPQSRTHVATMSGGDFRSNEQSVTVGGAGSLSIEHVDGEGNVRLMRKVAVDAGEVADSTFMSVSALREFLNTQIEDARSSGVLFSLHLKATMMKVSDPIVFGHAVRAFFAPVFDRHSEVLAAAGADPNDGWANVLAAVESLPAEVRDAVKADIAATLDERPGLAMVDSDRGITNLHVPSDVIVDASMPAMIRASGQMWNAEGDQQDTKAVIPDSSYASVFQAVIDDCRANGAYDPTTMGSVPNVGLMAQKAEEYGSHDKTYEVDVAGTMRVVSESSEVLMSHEVEAGDIWRMCTTKNAAIANWVDLAIERGQLTRAAVVFWLDADRPHDAQLIGKVGAQLAERQRTDASIGELDIRTLAPADACRFSLERIRRGLDTISVTGNVLRDYNTDLFPDSRAGHLGQDALGRAAHGRRRAVRDGGRRLGTQARPADGGREPLALGQSRRVPCPRGVARAPRTGYRELRRAAPGRHARRSHRHLARRRPRTQPPGKRARQPRQPLPPREVLGRRDGQARHRRRVGRAVRTARRRTRRQREPDHRRARRLPRRSR